LILAAFYGKIAKIEHYRCAGEIAMPQSDKPAGEVERPDSIEVAQEKRARIEAAVMLTKNGRLRSLRERMADYSWRAMP
jgi:hypothetical protein